MGVLDEVVGETTEGKYSKVVKWWQEQSKNTREEYLTLLYDYRILFAKESAGIEGNTLTTKDSKGIFDDDKVSNYTGTVTSLVEIKNQKFLFNTAINRLADKESITPDLIRKFHRTLMYGVYDDTRWNKGERPGKFKIGDYCTGQSEVGSYPEDVEEDITNLCNEITEFSSDILLIASYFHLQFESIHPFADGNGRLGRMLLNYYLMLNNYPPCILYEEDKNTYYLALDVWDRTGKLDGFKKFLMEQTIKTWKHIL